MPKIRFINHTGAVADIDAEVGQSLMEVATGAMLDGILAECGGACSCATCHVIVAEEWAERLPIAEDDETDMLEAAVDPGPRSRLSCQVQVTTDLDGLVVHLPREQL